MEKKLIKSVGITGILLSTILFAGCGEKIDQIKGAVDDVKSTVDTGKQLLNDGKEMVEDGKELMNTVKDVKDGQGDIMGKVKEGQEFLEKIKEP